ncbi:MAG: HTH domain-containing protein [Chloroflexi bacterium]|nr:HTH domain-containing protein [Chloroflexota bacterium]
MGRGKTKDRTARWANMEHLLYQTRAGLTIKELSEKCGVSIRQIYRDIHDLEEKLGIKLWQEESRWGIAEGHFLPPIRFSLSEALTIFLAARLMMSYSHRYDPSTASAFIKLNSISRVTGADSKDTELDADSSRVLRQPAHSHELGCGMGFPALCQDNLSGTGRGQG